MTLVPGPSHYRVPLYRFCDTVGDGSGAIDANGNYAAAVQEFKVVPAATETFVIHRLIVALSGTPGSIDADGYGVGAALTNGIKIRVKDAVGVVADFTDTVNHPVDAAIKTSAGWGHMCFDVDIKAFGVGAEHLVIRWTFARSGQPILLRGKEGEYFSLDLNDDFSSRVSEQSFKVQGYRAAWG